MKKKLRIYLVSVAALAVAGCGGELSGDGSVVAESTGRSESDVSNGRARGLEEASAGERDDPKGSEPEACSPIPGHSPRCTSGKGNTFCCGLYGHVYDWYPEEGCKRRIHSPEDGVYECLDTGLADRGGILCAPYWAFECLERDRSADVTEVLLSPATHQHEIYFNVIARAGWQKCLVSFADMVGNAPDCP